MKSISILFFATMFILPLFGQEWNPIEERSIPQRGQRNISPQRFITAYVDDAEIKEILWSAPDELKFNPDSDSHTLINILMADGSTDEFSIVQYQMMEPRLAEKYSQIRTFHGLSTSNAARRIRINYTVHGLRATITDKNGQTYIDHFQRNDKNHKIIYRRNDFTTLQDWECLYQEEKSKVKDNHESDSRSGDCVFRSYRFAMTATGEYSNYHGAFSETDSSLVMSAIVTTVDRVNDVFEQDITMRLILINNNTDILYYDPSSDPFTSVIGGSLLNQNQSNTDAVIGSANYDLGHIVSTGDGGVAQLGVPCSNSKARGATGRNTPEGDPFDIDYVAHEIGHQLGANHTQNNSCQRNNSTAMEPGSASTIMGYAGICSPNVQNNSDAYFHAISIQEMNVELASNSCHAVISLSNVAPVVNALTNKSIPHSTPFVLDVVATDGDGDVLTYNWEQMDHEVGPVMPPVGTNAQGPMFRSIFATTDSKRYFPNISAISTGVSETWEVLPTVNRNMDFRVTVRDNAFAPGCTDEQDITLDVEGNAGPFVVTSQNTATTWFETQSVTITWDVANTDLAPVSCSNVDILLSYDSGLTYPTTIISSTANDGSATITVPLGVTTTARIMVKCSDNVFFDINDTDMVINEGLPSFAINTNPPSGSTFDDMSIDFTIESSSILGYTDAITLTVSDLPAGATATIATNPIIPGSTTSITIDNLDGQIGDFGIKITGVSGTITAEAIFDLTVESSSCIVKSITGLNIIISSNGTPTITSSINILDKGIVTDLSVIDLKGIHSYVSDLNFTLISPDNTSLAFWSEPCTQQNNFDINFDDEALNSNIPCPPIDGGIYLPDIPLSAFNTKQVKGEWTLSIYDDFDADGGALNSWGLEICLDAFCDLTVDEIGFTDTHGTLLSALNCAIDGDTIYLESSIAGMTINAGTGSMIIDENIVIIADPSENIRVISNGNIPTFIINSGKTVTFIGFDIENGNSTIGVIENNGALTLRDLDVTTGQGFISVQNQNTASLIIDGDCRLQEE